MGEGESLLALVQQIRPAYISKHLPNYSYPSLRIVESTKDGLCYQSRISSKTSLYLALNKTISHERGLPAFIQINGFFP